MSKVGVHAGVPTKTGALEEPNIGEENAGRMIPGPRPSDGKGSSVGDDILSRVGISKEKSEKDSLEEASPSQAPDFVSRRLRRRVRQHLLRLIVFCALGAGSASYLANVILAPDDFGARLSAQQAPPKADWAPQWRDLAAMNRDFTTHILKQGSSLAQLMSEQRVPAAEAQSALVALRKIFDTRSLKPGQEIRLFWEGPADDASAQRRFAGFDFIPLPRQHIVVRRLARQSYDAVNFDRPLTDRQFFANTLVERSVYEAARGAGLAPITVIRLIRLFSYNVDFQRDIREGDRLEVLYTRRFDEENNLAEEGKILYAALTNNGKRLAFWGLEGPDGRTGFYDEQGKSAQRLLMKTPVDGARLSSRYGRRRHPILGYTRMHRGLDFAAASGTPIYAAGDGTITRIGKNGSYGNYIRIQHKNGFETAYAHMRRFSAGLKKGSQVRQGDVIGQVGQTGLVSGPHLHYEVLQNGKQINPATLELPAARTLDRASISVLETQRSQINQTIRMLSAADTGQTRIRASTVSASQAAPPSSAPATDSGAAR